MGFGGDFSTIPQYGLRSKCLRVIVVCMRTEIADVGRTEWAYERLSARQGIMRVAELRELGCSPHELRKLVSAGGIARPARGWVALPSADPELIVAAQNSSRLSCVTQARRLGLWDLGERRLHLAPISRGSRVDPRHVTHWSRTVREPDRWSLEHAPENVLAHVAFCRPYEEAFAIWESALNKRILDLPLLRTLPYTGVARQLLDDCTAYSDSGLESYVKVRTRRLRLRVLAQIYIEGHAVDFLLGDRLVLQVDGSSHTGAQRTSDNRHDALLQLLGYHVIRVGYEQVMFHWPDVFASLLDAISRDLHVAR